MKGITLNYWEPVTDKEIDSIHKAACQLLEELGKWAVLL